MKKTSFFVAAFLILFASAGLSAVTEKDLQDKQSFGNYEVRIYRNDDSGEGLLKIMRNGKVVFSEEGISYRLGLIYKDMPEDKLVKIGNDITGDGQPNLVVSHWSGGAHCCFSYYVFNIGKDFKLLDVIDGGDNDLSKFIDVDNDGKLEFVGNDWTFAYWNECFAGSPAPSIVLKYKDGKYRLASDLMKKPLPSKEEENKVMQEIQNRLKQLREDTAEERKKPYAGMDLRVGADTGYFGWIKNGVIVPAPVWGHMLDLIYTGHPKEAWIFLDKIMPGNSLEKKQFIADFRKQLSESPYWDSIKVIIDKNE